MPRDKRVAIIKNLEKERRSRIIAYVTGDRSPGLETRIGTDVFPFFYKILAAVGNQKQIDLFLYTTGGATMAGWGLVNLLREFCERLCVLIPFKAQSTGTLIALGADEIVMGRMGQLSPVDPSITSPFNPTFSPVQGQPPQFLPVSVEDVVAFLDLAREEAKLSNESSLAEVFRLLASDVRPLALGSVYRAKQQIGMLAEKLLRFHMGNDEGDKIKAIVATLIRELYSHDYLIGRKEARELIGLKVSPCGDPLERLMMDVFSQYAEDMELTTPYQPEVVVGNQTTKIVKFDRAFIESAEQSYVFRTRKEIKRFKTTQQGLPVEGFQERTLEEGWVPE